MSLLCNEQGPQRLRSVPLFDNLHLEDSFDDNGVAGQQVLDLLVLEDRRLSAVSLGAAGPHSAAEDNRCKCAHLLRDLATTADLPPHSVLFSQQLLVRH